MSKSKKHNPISDSDIKWPSRKKLDTIVNELSSDKVEGSFVISKNAQLSDKVKYELCRMILEYRRIHTLSQKELAKKLKSDEPEISRVLHYKINRYSIERLIGFVTILYPKVKVEIEAA
jgi:predicted XRE-type DNA-binding protein